MMRERRMPPITRQVRVDRCHACCVLGDPTRPYTVAPEQAVDRAGLGPNLVSMITISGASRRGHSASLVLTVLSE